MKKHIASLDGLRGIAIVLVMAHNLSVLDESPGRIASLLSRLVDDPGWIGVQLFFALSGFLITSILLATKDAPKYLSSFFGRRVLRIFPLYYAVLFVAFVVLPLAGHRPDGAEHQAWLWLYLANWAEPFGRTVPAFPHFWSLAVEEQFYLVWPFLVRRLSPAGLLKTCLLLAIVAFVSRVGLLAAGAGPATAYTFTICRMDALALGAAGAVLLEGPARAWITARRRAIGGAVVLSFVAGFLLTGGYARLNVRDQTVGYSILAIDFAALVVLAVLEDDARTLWVRLLRMPLFRELGRVSYGLYVFHMLVHLYIGVPLLHRFHQGPIPVVLAGGYTLLAGLATYLVSVVSYAVFERRFLDRKPSFQAR